MKVLRYFLSLSIFVSTFTTEDVVTEGISVVVSKNVSEDFEVNEYETGVVNSVGGYIVLDQSDVVVDAVVPVKAETSF